MQKNGGNTTQTNAVSTVFMVVKVPNATAPRIYYHGNAGGTAGFQLTGATNNCTVSVLSSTAITGAAYDLTKFQVIAWRLQGERRLRHGHRHEGVVHQRCATSSADWHAESDAGH